MLAILIMQKSWIDLTSDNSQMAVNVWSCLLLSLPILDLIVANKCRKN